MIYWQKFKKIPNYLVLFIIWLYQKIFSPTFGILRFLPFYPKNVCIFYPTCSEYGAECFKTYPFFKAMYKTIHRVGRCHPGNEPGIDMP